MKREQQKKVFILLWTKLLKQELLELTNHLKKEDVKAKLEYFVNSEIRKLTDNGDLINTFKQKVILAFDQNQGQVNIEYILSKESIEIDDGRWLDEIIK